MIWAERQHPEAAHLVATLACEQKRSGRRLVLPHQRTRRADAATSFPTRRGR